MISRISPDQWAGAAFAAAFVVLITLGPTILPVTFYAPSICSKMLLAIVAGVGVRDIIALLASLIGLGAVIASSATTIAVMKLLSAAYLVYMDVRMIMTASTAIEKLEKLTQKTTRAVFSDAATITVLNPKSIGFFIAFVPQLIQQTAPSVPQCALVLITFVSLGVMNALGFAPPGGPRAQPHQTVAYSARATTPWRLRPISLAAFTATRRRT